MTKHSIAKVCVLTASILGFSAPVWAAHPADKEVADPKKNVVEATKESCITGDIGINVVSQYVSRGLIFENQGGIIQPYADLYFQAYKGDGALTKVAVNLGIWDSFHSRHTDANPTSTTKNWYESDFTAGLALTFMKNFTITPSYYTFLSPNDGFSRFQGLNVNLSVDDTDWLGKAALHPHFTFLAELENKAGNGTNEGYYYELGIAPSLPAGPVTFTFPVTAGFGSGDFYAGDRFFGYISGGVTAAYAMKFMPACLGTWTAQASVTYYYLESTALRNFNTEPANDIRDGKNSEWVYSGGLSVAF